jgi:CheY-like chemotaxis protein
LGGTLRIESAPGRGTRVSIWLPESFEQAPAGDAGDAARTGRLAAGAALLVDDEEYIRLTTADMLTELGFEVHEAASAEAALDALDSGLRPDLLITDHLMPGMTGVELARIVRARQPQTKILIVSGFADVDGIDASLARLTKPFVQRELAAAMADLGAAGTPRQENYSIAQIDGWIDSVAIRGHRIAKASSQAAPRCARIRCSSSALASHESLPQHE